MSPADARTVLLRAECRRDWEAIRTHLDRARAARASDGPAQAALVALSLDHAYQAFETILLRIERAVGLPDRTGSGWHTSLLADAALSLPGLRPPLFPEDARMEWDALLRFRHFLRHAYVIDLEPGKLTTNVVRLERAVTLTEAWLASVLDALAPTVE